MSMITAEQATKRASDVRFRTGFQSDKATAANAALAAGFDAKVRSAEVWANVRATADMGDVQTVDAASFAARRAANAADQAVHVMFGLVSVSASSLWVATDDGRIAQVEDTSHGSDYLDGIRFDNGRVEEFPIENTVGYFDSHDDAEKFIG